MKLPRAEPHASLNFEEGEVLYENSKLPEWSKFWNISILYGFSWCAFFIPYNLCVKSHLPMEHAVDNLFLSYFMHNYMWFDYNSAHILVVSGAALYCVNIA